MTPESPSPVPRLLRAALLPWLVAAAVVLVREVFRTFRLHEETRPDEAMALVGLLAFPAVAWCACSRGVLAVQGLLRIPAVLLAPRAPADARDRATARALRPLPVASALGLGVLVVNARPGFGGWPGDVLCGAMGGMLGGIMALRLIQAWFRIRRLSVLG